VNSVPRVSVVIPVYQAVGQIEPLLNQLSVLKDCEVILTDDASPDGSATVLAQNYPWLTVIESNLNTGFGANVMRGVAHSAGKYLVLLNSDVELCGDSITPLIAALEADPELFAAMPLIHNTHLGMVENLARLYCHRGLCWHTELAEQKLWTERVRDWLQMHPTHERWELTAEASTQAIPAILCGAAFACHRDCFLQLGGFDPRYRPFYWEDVALGFAAARRGWRCVTVPSSLVIHRHSESISAKVGERKLRYLLLNQLRFVRQFHCDLRSCDLRFERLWWLARSGKALASGDMSFAWEYLKAAVLP
jgi:GT2 family glycosyltransferase